MAGASSQLDHYLANSVPESALSANRDGDITCGNKTLVLSVERGNEGATTARSSQLAVAGSPLGPHQKCFLEGGSQILRDAITRRKQPWDLECQRNRSQTYAQAPRLPAALPRPGSHHHSADRRQGKLRDSKVDLAKQADRTIKGRASGNHRDGSLGYVPETFRSRSFQRSVSYDIPMPPPLLDGWRFGGLTASKETKQTRRDGTWEGNSPAGVTVGHDDWHLPAVPRLHPNAGQLLSFGAADSTRRELSHISGTQHPYLPRLTGAASERSGESLLSRASLPFDASKATDQPLIASTSLPTSQTTMTGVSASGQLSESLSKNSVDNEGGSAARSSSASLLRKWSSRDKAAAATAWSAQEEVSLKAWAKCRGAASEKITSCSHLTASLDGAPQYFERLRGQWSSFCNRYVSSAAASLTFDSESSVGGGLHQPATHIRTMPTACFEMEDRSAELFQSSAYERGMSEWETSGRQTSERVQHAYMETSPQTASTTALSPSLLGRKRKQPPQHPLSECDFMAASLSLPDLMGSVAMPFDTRLTPPACSSGGQIPGPHHDQAHTMNTWSKCPSDVKVPRGNNDGSSSSSSTSSDGVLFGSSVGAASLQSLTSSGQALVLEAGNHEAALERLQHRLTNAAGHHDMALCHLQDMQGLRVFSSCKDASGDHEAQLSTNRTCSATSGEECAEAAAISSINLRMMELEINAGLLHERAGEIVRATESNISAAAAGSQGDDSKARRLLYLAEQGLQLNRCLSSSTNSPGSSEGSLFEGESHDVSNNGSGAEIIRQRYPDLT